MGYTSLNRSHKFPKRTVAYRNPLRNTARTDSAARFSTLLDSTRLHSAFDARIEPPRSSTLAKSAFKETEPTVRNSVSDESLCYHAGLFVDCQSSSAKPSGMNERTRGSCRHSQQASRQPQPYDPNDQQRAASGSGVRVRGSHGAVWLGWWRGR